MSGIVLAVVGNSYGSKPVNTVAPALSGTQTVGQTLSVSTGTWIAAPAPTYSYQWQRNGSNISGATSSTYTLVSADGGQIIRCVVTATNASGATSANSNNSGNINQIPSNTAVPTLSGSATIGSTLSSTTGTWAAYPTPTYTYQWLRNGSNISGATSSSYTVTLSDAGKTLSCRVTATNSAGSASATSASTGTVAEPSMGSSVAGGYYSGKIVQGGSTYYVIVAPKSSGQTDSLAARTSTGSNPTASVTLNNGPAASSSMDSATYPAAQFCEGLSIGGYTDWYLPSRDELELCYRNLKPTTTSNNTAGRPKSSLTYPENNDTSTDTAGINRNSSPTGSAYTTSSPAQTSASAFQSGGSEAFSSGSSTFYWTSSDWSSSFQWGQRFATGEQNAFSKTTATINSLVRAVRRVAA